LWLCDSLSTKRDLWAPPTSFSSYMTGKTLKFWFLFPTFAEDLLMLALVIAIEADFFYFCKFYAVFI